MTLSWLSGLPFPYHFRSSLKNVNLEQNSELFSAKFTSQVDDIHVDDGVTDAAAAVLCRVVVRESNVVVAGGHVEGRTRLVRMNKQQEEDLKSQRLNESNL